MKTFILSIFLVLLHVSTAFPLAVNDPAPLFSIKDGKGELFDLGSFTGAKKKYPVKGVVLCFFASYCRPCRNELPVLDSLVDEFEKQGVRIVIIGVREGFDKINDLLTGLKVSKPITLSDANGQVAKKYGVFGLPWTVIIGADGKVKDILRGDIQRPDKVLREKIKLLK